jgi:hypothetical protein
MAMMNKTDQVPTIMEPAILVETQNRWAVTKGLRDAACWSSNHSLRSAAQKSNEDEVSLEGVTGRSSSYKDKIFFSREGMQGGGEGNTSILITCHTGRTDCWEMRNR